MAAKKEARFKPTIGVKTITFAANKLPARQLATTFWAHALNDEEIELDVPEIEALFQKKEIVKVVHEEKVDKAEEVQLLDPRRENNCGIQMSKIKVSPEVVIEGLQTMTAEKFLAAGKDHTAEEVKDMVELLISCSPHTDERSTLLDFDGDAENISKVDKFFMQLLAVQGNLEARLKSMLLMLTFEQRHFVACQHAREKLDACTGIKKSLGEGGKLLYICSFALQLGNFLNFGNHRFGEAQGYKLDSLLKLADSKAPNAPEGTKVTLAHYVVKHCHENAPAAMHVLMDLECVASAFAYPLDQLTADVGKIKADITFIKRFLIFHHFRLFFIIFYCFSSFFHHFQVCSLRTEGDRRG